MEKVLPTLEFKKFTDFPRGTMYDILCDAYSYDERNKNKRSYMLIQNVVVHPDYRRKGYGKLLCKALMSKWKSDEVAGCVKKAQLFLLTTIFSYLCSH